PSLSSSRHPDPPQRSLPSHRIPDLCRNHQPPRTQASNPGPRPRGPRPRPSRTRSPLLDSPLKTRQVATRLPQEIRSAAPLSVNLEHRQLSDEETHMRKLALLCFSLLCFAAAADAAIFSQIHGVVHDPQHRPIAGAHIELHAANSAFTQSTLTAHDGSFSFSSIPLGDYILTI